MIQKTDIESPGPMEKEVKAKKKPLVSCDKYDEEERKTLYEEEKSWIFLDKERKNRGKSLRKGLCRTFVFLPYKHLFF